MARAKSTRDLACLVRQAGGAGNLAGADTSGSCVANMVAFGKSARAVGLNDIMSNVSHQIGGERAGGRLSGQYACMDEFCMELVCTSLFKTLL